MWAQSKILVDGRHGPFTLMPRRVALPILRAIGLSRSRRLISVRPDRVGWAGSLVGHAVHHPGWQRN
jgi:hypothetical protein